MAWLSRDEVKGIVAEALKEVADFSGEVGTYKMSTLSERHQVLFSNTIPKRLEAQGFRVTLNDSVWETFETMDHLIDYIEKNQKKLS